MNYTMFYHCTCGFEKSLNEGDDYTIKQCSVCLNLESFRHDMTYVMSCMACSEEKELPDNYEFCEETCAGCGLKGRSGMKEYDNNVLFDIHAKDRKTHICKVCKSEDFIEESVQCPSCKNNTLERETSSVW